MTNVIYDIKGGSPITGRINCMGAKNLATKAMVASLLSSEPTILWNVPNIGDVEITKDLLVSSGITIDWERNNGRMLINPKIIASSEVYLSGNKSNRIPILLLSVLLHRKGEGAVPAVGGDLIGKRNVDYHIKALEMFGATVMHQEKKYVAKSPAGLKSCHIKLPYPSVGATETCIFLSVLAQGTSVIKNVAIEPEIIELITMLRSMGAIIFLSDHRELTICGVRALEGTDFFIIGDRIEAASWACLACASNGQIQVSGIRASLLGNFLSYFTRIGGGFKLINHNTILFFRKNNLESTEIETDVFPGFSTDLQQSFATLLTQCKGISVIHETVYEKRFDYLLTLNKLGANTEIVSACLGSTRCRYYGMDHKHSALIKGNTRLKAITEEVLVPDIRAGLSYLIAAVLSKGDTRLAAADHIERGYGNLEEKLKNTNIGLKRSA